MVVVVVVAVAVVVVVHGRDGHGLANISLFRNAPAMRQIYGGKRQPSFYYEIAVPKKRKKWTIVQLLFKFVFW